MNKLLKSLVVSVLAITVVALGAALMIGPQVMVTVTASIVAGVFFAVVRFPLAMGCFGFPLTFGLLSAWIGMTECPGYMRTPAFAVSAAIGLVGVALVVMGIWKTIPGNRRVTASA